MRFRRFISWLIVTAVVVLPLLLVTVASAESGCHKGGCQPPKTAPPQD
jgi:hypothetical protein